MYIYIYIYNNIIYI